MIGIGVDVVEIERFRRSLERTPTMRERLFTSGELEALADRVDPVPGLAARFAAREATMKSLGLGLGALEMLRWMARGEDFADVVSRLRNRHGPAAVEGALPMLEAAEADLRSMSFLAPWFR